MAARKFLGDLIARYTGVGGATADASNPLSVRGPGALFDGNTGSHQVRVNKAAVGDTASFLFQEGFSGRAEFGLIGNDDFELKVSADGSSFAQAWVIDDSTAVTDFKQEPTYLGQGLWHTGDFQISDYMPLAGGAFTGNVDIDVDSGATLRVLSGAEDVITFGLYDRQATADQKFEIRYDASAANTAEFDVNGTARMSFAKDGGTTFNDSVTVNSRLTMADTLDVNGQTLYLNNGVIASHNNDGGAGGDHSASTNLDHIWHDDAANTWHFVSDGSYKQSGNSSLVVDRLGLGGATPDATNRLSINTTAALFNNAGGDLRLTLNKAAEADDATLTFQDAFSTKAQMGLSGNDDFTIKVGSAFTTALVIDEDTGVVTMPATPVSKFTINKTGRVYLYAADDRWVTPHDDVYGANYYQNAESGGTGANPLLEWEHMGEYVRAGTVVHDLSIFGRITDVNAIQDLEIAVYYIEPEFPDRWNGEATTGIDNDGEILNTVLWRGFWKSGVASVGASLNAYTGPVNDQIRRKLDLDFTVPIDGQLRIYFKPTSIDPRPDTNNDYFYQSHSWCLSYA